MESAPWFDKKTLACYSFRKVLTKYLLVSVYVKYFKYTTALVEKHSKHTQTETEQQTDRQTDRQTNRQTKNT